MTALCPRGRTRFSLLHRLAAALLLITIFSPTAFAAAAEPITVLLDQARILQLPERAATVVVGNPLIADLSIQPGGLAVIPARAMARPTLSSSTVMASC